MDADLQRAIKLSIEEAENRLCVDDPPFGLIRHKIKDDGHCFFGAIGFFLKKDALVVRREICEWLEQNIYKFEYKGILMELCSNPLTEEKKEEKKRRKKRRRRRKKRRKKSYNYKLQRNRSQRCNTRFNCYNTCNKLYTNNEKNRWRC